MFPKKDDGTEHSTKLEDIQVIGEDLESDPKPQTLWMDDLQK
jgi:hypothetical protein